VNDSSVVLPFLPSAPADVFARRLSRLFGVAALLLFAACLALSPDVKGFVAGLALAALALCAAFDVTELRVPNLLTYGGTLLVLLTAALTSSDAVLDSAAGAMVGGGFMLAISLMSRGKVGMGDAKLAALGGSLTGVDYVLAGLFVGTLSAALVYIGLLLAGRITRTQALPYAPFLASGFAVIALITGTTLGL
jgi:prepilin signal peptidase PulO-like enzyme (type II secretory pathway)